MIPSQVFKLHLIVKENDSRRYNSIFRHSNQLKQQNTLSGPVSYSRSSSQHNPRPLHISQSQNHKNEPFQQHYQQYQSQPSQYANLIGQMQTQTHNIQSILKQRVSHHSKKGMFELPKFSNTQTSQCNYIQHVQQVHRRL